MVARYWRTSQGRGGNSSWDKAQTCHLGWPKTLPSPFSISNGICLGILKCPIFFFFHIYPKCHTLESLCTVEVGWHCLRVLKWGMFLEGLAFFKTGLCTLTFIIPLRKRKKEKKAETIRKEMTSLQIPVFLWIIACKSDFWQQDATFPYPGLIKN